MRSSPFLLLYKAKLLYLAEKLVASITLKNVRLDNVPGQAVHVWNTDPEKHNVIWLERMFVNNTGYDATSRPSVQLQLKSAYALIRNCLFNNVTATDSNVISVSFDSDTTSRVSTAKVAQNSFMFCSKGGVVYGNNTGTNNATVRMTKNTIQHNLADEAHSLVQFNNMSVELEGNFLYNNTGKWTLEIGSDSECNRLPVRAEGNIFWFNAALKHAAQYTVCVNATDVTFRENILNNPTNDYELSTRPTGDVNVTDASIDFANNWWGSGVADFVQDRIKDGRVIEGLPVVTSSPFDKVPPSGLHFSSKSLAYCVQLYLQMDFLKRTYSHAGTRTHIRTDARTHIHTHKFLPSCRSHNYMHAQHMHIHTMISL